MGRNIAFVSLSIALLGASGCIAPERARCDGFDTCAACIAQSGCGYCGAPGASGCAPGSSLGDREGLCPRDWWSFAECDDCADHEGCRTCAGDSGCAYCLESERCAAEERLYGVCASIVDQYVVDMCR